MPRGYLVEREDQRQGAVMRVRSLVEKVIGGDRRKSPSNYRYDSCTPEKDSSSYSNIPVTRLANIDGNIRFQ